MCSAILERCPSRLPFSGGQKSDSNLNTNSPKEGRSKGMGAWDAAGVTSSLAGVQMLQAHPHLEQQGLFLLQSAGAMTAGTKSQADRATVRMSLSRASPSSHGHPPTQAMVTWFHQESGSWSHFGTNSPAICSHSLPDLLTPLRTTCAFLPPLSRKSFPASGPQTNRNSRMASVLCSLAPSGSNS